MWISLLKSVSLLGFLFFFFNQEGAGLKSNRLIIEDKRVSVTFPRVILEQVPTSLNCKADHSLQQIESSHIFGDV